MATLKVVGATGYIGRRLIQMYPDEVKKISLRLDQDILEYDFDTLNNDTIAFCAAVSEPSVCASQYEIARKINVESTIEFIEKAIQRSCKVIFLSSDLVYGMSKNNFDETKLINPFGVYAKMKTEVENKFLENPLFKSLRLSYVTSKEDKFTKYLIDCAEKNIVAEIFDPLLRSVVHRDDVVNVIFSLFKNWQICENQFINCGGPETLSRVDIVEVLKESVFNNIEYTVIKPDKKFYMDRPEIVSMRSPNLIKILGREPKFLKESVYLEFNTK